MTDPEPELIEYPFSWSIEHNGRRLTVNMVRLATERGWSLEVTGPRLTLKANDGPPDHHAIGGARNARTAAATGSYI